MQVERLKRDYAGRIEVRWAPFLLDPTIPPEGRERKPYTQLGDPPTPLEERGQREGLEFRRGRTFTPNSHLSMEVAQFAEEVGHEGPLHELMFKEHFTELGNLGDVDSLVRIGAQSGLDAAGLREALETRRYEQEVDHRMAWAYGIGVNAVPTFIFNDRYAIVGAQEYPAFQRMMERFGHLPPPGVEPPPPELRLTFPGDTAAEES